MLRTSTITFRSIDRDTGTAISSEQKDDCRFHYAVIRNYIDEIQRNPPFALRWTRTKRRCSTSELLGAVEQVSDYIRWRPQKIIDGVDGIWLLSEASIEAHGSDGSGTAILTPQFYQSASNLLHEIMSRLVDGEGIPTDKPESEVTTASPDAGGLRIPQSKIQSFEANPALSILTKSLATSGSFIAASSKISDDELENLVANHKSSNHKSRGSDEMANGVTFEDDPDDQASERAVAGEETSNTANDWVFEYLRGGVLSQPLANPRVEEYESAASFAFTMDEIFPRTKNLPRYRHLDFNESSLHGKNSSYSLFGQSNQSGHDFFKTPKSIMSGNSLFRTPHSRLGGLERAVQPGSPSAWNKYLREKGLIPDPFDEMDWSGRGQHAEFNANEESDVPLTLEKALGHSATALVESVRCRRIRLARKTVMVSRRLKKEEVIKEVENLQRLKHPHVIRVVGTYTLPRKLSILLYPVAEFTLDQFLESIEDEPSAEKKSARLYSVSTFLRCLAKAFAYIHENAIKHMDVKPKNLLVRDMRSSTICNQGHYKIYIADFGIARSYRSIEECDTESPIAFTRIYAAPEVVAQERRDQKADIFSLGAVYCEMLAVLAQEHTGTSNLDVLTNIREANLAGNKAYYGNIGKIQTWLSSLSITSYGFESFDDYFHITNLAAQMLNVEPANRPTASTVINSIPFLAFCCDVNGGCEPFEVADRPAVRQVYDRALEISEANSVYFRCMVDGCVKVYRSREKLEYHKNYGHGGSLDQLKSADGLAPSQPTHDQNTTLSAHEEVGTSATPVEDDQQDDDDFEDDLYPAGVMELRAYSPLLRLLQRRI